MKAIILYPYDNNRSWSGTWYKSIRCTNANKIMYVKLITGERHYILTRIYLRYNHRLSKEITEIVKSL